MDNSCSSSGDEPQMISETFDETNFLPVIVGGQTVTLSDLETDPLAPDTLLPFSPTIVTFDEGTTVALIPESPETNEVSLAVDDSREEISEGEEETTSIPYIVADGSSVFRAHMMELEGGTIAYIHSQPQEGSQAVQLEDGTVAFITLTQPIQQQFDTESCEAEVDVEIVEQPKKQKTFVCPEEGCGRLYNSAHHLKVHERTHTGSRPYTCTETGCTKAFSTDYSRKAHVRTHTGEKPYKCPFDNCVKGFKTSGDLQKHIRIHTGERPFVCPVEGCHRSFTTSNIRKVHIRTHTGERPYVCNYPNCDKAFASATNYKNHIRIHSGEKPYCCSVEGCNKRFTEYSSLYKHNLVHTQDKPYSCSVCGRSYRQGSTLTVHKRAVHGIIETDDGTEIVLGSVFTQKVLKKAVAKPTGNAVGLSKKISGIKTVTANLLNDEGYIDSEQIFIIEDIPEHLKALEHIQDPDDEELQAALNPLQEQ